jgi:hypothetical protein
LTSMPDHVRVYPYEAPQEPEFVIESTVETNQELPESDKSLKDQPAAAELEHHKRSAQA